MDSNIEGEMSEEAFRASRVFKLLGNLLRYRMFTITGEQGSVFTSTLANTLNRNPESISYHVDKLKERDMIYTEKEGRKTRVHIKREDLYEAIKGLEKLFLR